MSTSRSPFGALNREWAALCARPMGPTRRRWSRTSPVLAGVARLDELCCADWDRRVDYFDGVAELAKTGDQMAARAMVQMLVPGLRKVSCELRRLLNRVELHELDSDLIAEAWFQVRAVSDGRSTLRTPGVMLRSIRRNTIRHHKRMEGRRLTTEPIVTSSPPRCQSVGGEVELEHQVDVFTPQEPAVDDVAVTCEVQLSVAHAVASGVLDRRAAEVIWLVAVEDRTIKDAARRAGISRSSAFRARDAGLATLRTHLDAAA